MMVGAALSPVHAVCTILTGTPATVGRSGCITRTPDGGTATGAGDRVTRTPDGGTVTGAWATIIRPDVWPCAINVPASQTASARHEILFLKMGS